MPPHPATLLMHVITSALSQHTLSVRSAAGDDAIVLVSFANRRFGGRMAALRERHTADRTAVGSVLAEQGASSTHPNMPQRLELPPLTCGLAGEAMQAIAPAPSHLLHRPDILAAAIADEFARASGDGAGCNLLTGDSYVCSPPLHTCAHAQGGVPPA